MAANKTVRSFLDFGVDGRSLYGVMVESGFDNVSPIWLDATAAAATDMAIARLLGEEPGDAPGGRVSVYVCAECGDLGCGAVTVQLDVGSDRVTWSDWGYQTNYEDAVHRDDLPPLSTLTFDRAQYEDVLRRARGEISSDES